jgi:hypothetical protein
MTQGCGTLSAQDGQFDRHGRGCIGLWAYSHFEGSHRGIVK